MYNPEQTAVAMLVFGAVSFLFGCVWGSLVTLERCIAKHQKALAEERKEDEAAQTKNIGELNDK